jgi:hypothetical protein
MSIVFLRYPQRKKCGGDKLGERGGHSLLLGKRHLCQAIVKATLQMSYDQYTTVFYSFILLHYHLAVVITFSLMCMTFWSPCIIPNHITNWRITTKFKTQATMQTQLVVLQCMCNVLSLPKDHSHLVPISLRGNATVSHFNHKGQTFCTKHKLSTESKFINLLSPWDDYRHRCM